MIKGYSFSLDGTYFTSEDAYQHFLVFALILNLIILENNKKLTNWISTGVSPEKIKLFDANYTPTRTNLANGRVSLKFNYSFLMQKVLLHYIVSSH